MQSKDNNTYSEKADSQHSNEHDSMFGMILFEGFCGGALGECFAEAVDLPDWASELDADKILDLYEEFRNERTNGGFKLGVNGALMGNFNHFGDLFYEKSSDAFCPAGQLEKLNGQGTLAP